MKATDVQTIEDAIAIVEERGLTHVKVGLFDNDGVLRGKYMSKAKFESSLKMDFLFVMSYWVGMLRINFMTMQNTPAGIPVIQMHKFAYSLTLAEKCMQKRECYFF